MVKEQIGDGVFDIDAEIEVEEKNGRGGFRPASGGPALACLSRFPPLILPSSPPSSTYKSMMGSEDEGAEKRGEDYESEHVHTVYEQIASHFSSTRYKPWPIIERFLQNLPTGSVGLDIGCGNGKYLAVNPNVFIVGSDRSHNLVSIASQHQPHAVAVADILDLPHQASGFDFAISIAVVHHLSTPERRVEAVVSILETLKSGGQALIYVWALEQGSSRRGWSEGDDQDVMVPWVMRGKKAKGQDAPPEDKTFHRYYHLYRQGELEDNIRSAGGVVLESGYEKDNWWAIAGRAKS